MPRVAATSEPSVDSVPDLHTRVLCNCKIPPSQHAPASDQPSTANKLKPCRVVEPPEGWEEHMFGLRDRRHSMTPRASATTGPVVSSPSTHQEVQGCGQSAEMEEVETGSKNSNSDAKFSSEDDDPEVNEEDELDSSSEEDDKRSNSNDDKVSLDDHEGEEGSSDYNGRYFLFILISGFGAPPVKSQWAWCPTYRSKLGPLDARDYNFCRALVALMMLMHALQMFGLFQTTSRHFHRPHHQMSLIVPVLKRRPYPPLCEVATETPNLDRRVKRSGYLSKAALEEICAFVKNVKTTAEELGQRHGRSACNILVATGFGVKPSHTKLNEANLFRSWYWATQPKPDGGAVALSYPSINPTSLPADRNAINNLITKEYNSLMKDVPKDDLAVRREKLKLVYEWSENSSAVPTNQSVKSIAVRVANAKTQFSGLAKAWSNLEDIEIVGAVMYVGQDPAGRQTSGIFGGSDVVREFINAKAIDVRGLMDKYTAIFKCLRNGDGTEARLVNSSSTGDAATALGLRCRIKETPRDRNRRVFGSMMKEKLLAALRDIRTTHGVEVSDPQKVAWNRLLELMRKCHLTIVNWPHVPYLRRKLGHLYDRQTDDKEEQDSLDDVPEIEIKCWNQDIINTSDANPLKGEVPLVKAADGTILRKISDDPEWQKYRQEEDHQRQDTEVQRQRQLPFPSCKRPRMEVSNDDTTTEPGHQEAPREERRNTRPIARDSCHDPSAVPTRPHTREPGPSDLPTLAPRYRDLHRNMPPGHARTREPSPSQLPNQYEDSGNDRANYREPGPSNIPYNALPPAHRDCFPPFHQGYHRIPSRTDHRVYYDDQYINDYNPPTQPAAPQWVNRGTAAPQYEDDFNGDYVDDYF
ncbi:hypothetical protein BKA83DRAFT_4125836 [Pisolithus microcarpus]|nr:hypothetical protein BKA83DRAFT_4125836 [Pisolithus microcarpus]